MFKIKNIYGEPTKKKLLKSNPPLKVSILSWKHFKFSENLKWINNISDPHRFEKVQDKLKESWEKKVVENRPSTKVNILIIN